MTALVLGPLLRHVGENSATVWVETAAPCTVRVHGEGFDASAPTFTVHGHHYAVVDVEGLPPASRLPYEVSLDDDRVWPLEGSAFGPSALATLDPSTPLALSFGSCRRSPDRAGAHGPDSLAALAHRLTAGGTWPDAILMLGDQVYADELGPEMTEYLERRRADDGDHPEGEISDYEDYTELYKMAWADDEAVRWLLSTVPVYAIFDDHDIRDDWNTSYAWRRQIWTLPWWRDRIVGGIGSYWVYQHLGNLSPAERAQDPAYAAVVEASRDGGDGGDILDAFAERADREPTSMRWSYAHDWGDVRLVVVDSRCSRLLTRDRRGMLDDEEFGWLDEQIRGDVDHLLIASSLPYLLAPGIHHLESWNEAVAEGAWGGLAARFGEKVRQAVDLEHWAAFRASFDRVAAGVLATARGERGDAPATISFLSGDVHYSYVARVTRPGTDSSIAQVVCSPLRNPLPWQFRLAQHIGISRVLGQGPRLLARLARVPRRPLRWRVSDGPWFENAIATMVLDGRDAHVVWDSPDADADTGMRRVAEVSLG